MIVWFVAFSRSEGGADTSADAGITFSVKPLLAGLALDHYFVRILRLPARAVQFDGLLRCQWQCSTGNTMGHLRKVLGS